MTTRLMFKAGAVVLMAGLFGACSSDNPTNGGATAVQPSSGDTLAPVDPAATTGDEGTTASAPAGQTPVVDDLCTTIPDLAAIEAIIGVPVTDPGSVGAAGSQQTCGLIVTTTGGQDVGFTLIPNGTIAAQIEFIKINFPDWSIDIVPLEGAEGFYAGEGDSVYWEGNGGLYQVQALIDGDSRTASLNLLKAWLAM